MRALARLFMPRRSMVDAPASVYMRRAITRSTWSTVAGLAIAGLAHLAALPWLVVVALVWSSFAALALALAAWLLRVAVKSERRDELDQDPEYQATRWALGFVSDAEKSDVRRMLASHGYIEIAGKWQRIGRALDGRPPPV
jgi:hypothetical protein